MSSADDIIQSIVLAGDKEVIDGLNSIRDSGIKAFEAIKEASNGSAFSNLTAAIGGVAAAISVVTVGMFGWAASASEAVISMQRLGVISGASTDSITTLSTALTRASGDSANLTSSMRVMAQRIENDWGTIQKSFRSYNLEQEQATLNIERAQEQAQAASISASDTVITNSMRMAAAMGMNVDSTMKQANAYQLSRNAIMAWSNQIDQAHTSVKEGMLAIEAAQQREEELELNSIKNLQRYFQALINGVQYQGHAVQLSAENAAKGIIAAIGPAVDGMKDFTNNLGDVHAHAPQVYDAMFKIADAFSHTTDATLKTAIAVGLMGRGVSTQLIQAMSEGSESLKRMTAHLEEVGLTFTTIKEKGEDSDEFISKTFLQTLATLQTTVSILGSQFALLFGSTFTVTLHDINTLLEQHRTQILGWGRAIVESIKPIVVALLYFTTGFNAVRDLKLNPEQILQANSWLAFFNKIQTGATLLWTGLVNFYENIKPFVAGLIKSLTGFDLSTVLDFTPAQKKAEEGWKNTFTNIGVGAKSMGTIIGTVFNILGGLAKTVATTINNAFNLHISPEEIGLAALALWFVGFPKIVSKAIIAAGAALLPLGIQIAGLTARLGWMAIASVAAFIGPTGLVVLAGLAIGAFIAWNWDTIVDKASAAWDKIKSSFSSAVDDIKRRWADLNKGPNADADKGKSKTELEAEQAKLQENAASAKSPYVVMTEALVTYVQSVVSSFSKASSTMTDKALEDYNRLKAALDATQTSTNKSTADHKGQNAWYADDIPGHAQGGMVGGKGGVDTNVIRATAGEFVMKKSTVDHYGSGFMNSINNMSHAGFAVGGLIAKVGKGLGHSSMHFTDIPKYATGGLIGPVSAASAASTGGGGIDYSSGGKSGKSFTLVLEGKSFGGLTGPHNSIEALERHSASQQRSSVNTVAPSWKR